MATIQTIGTSSRDFSTLQSWEDAIPATPTGGYEGHCYNDSEFTGRVLISGHTTSAANYIRLTAATGQSFMDHASVRTHALYYSQSNGVAIHANPGTAGHVIEIDNDYVTIDRLQVKRSVASYANSVVAVTVGNLSNVIVRDSILVKDFSSSAAVLTIRNGKAINVVTVNHGATVGDGISMYKQYSTAPMCLNCLAINTASSGGTAFAVGGGSDDDCDITNCASFGYANATSSGSTPTGDYNATDLASGMPGAHSLFSRSAATEFESPSSAFDFRLKSGATLINAGNTNATYAPADISGYTRGSGTAGDIGPWEMTGSSVSVTDFGDESHRVGEIGVSIAGTSFGSSQGTGVVKVSPTNSVADSNAQQLTVTAWADTSITVNIPSSLSTLIPRNTNVYLFVVNDGGQSNSAGYVFQITPPIGVLALNLLN